MKQINLALSAQKKIKKGESGALRRGKERFRKMIVREMCLEGEHAIYAEENLQEVPIECKEYWEYLEEIGEHEKKTFLARKEEGSSRGGGDWPSTVARHP